MSMLEFHPLANLFPIIDGPEFDALSADIKANGLREPIVLIDGKVLDGRNRYRAGLIAEVVDAEGGNPRHFRQYDPDQDGEALAFVLSKNLARRHLNESQRAMVAARIATIPHGGDRKSDQAANLPLDPGHMSQERAAQVLRVSERLIRDARALQTRGTEALQKAVDAGRLAASAAAHALQLPNEKQDEIAAQAQAGADRVVRNTIKLGRRNAREEELGKRIAALPERKYGVIYADPEWEFVVFSKISGSDRTPDNHYPTSTEQEIAARDVHKIAAKDCMCALWVTDLARGIRVLESWGFTYKSYFVWVKDVVQIELTDAQRKTGLGDRTFTDVGPAGLGYWNRDRDEILLIGTRGDFPAPALGTQPESVIFAMRPRLEGEKRGRHSSKPEVFAEWIEKNWPTLPKIELNARIARKGWDVWGFEAPDAAPREVDADLYQRAVAIVRKLDKASVSLVQRHLEVGYNRASDIVERMQRENVITAPDHKGQRAVIPQPDEPNEHVGGERETIRPLNEIAPAEASALQSTPAAAENGAQAVSEILDPITGAISMTKAFDSDRDIPPFLRRSATTEAGKRK